MKLTSGVPGFDPVLGGGFPAGSTLVLHGPVGREREAFLIQFIAEALREGAPALVVVSPSSAATHRAALESAGLDLERAVADHRLKFVEWVPAKQESDDFLGPEETTSLSSKELANLGANISNAILALSRRGAKRAVLEILSPALEIGDLLRVYALAQSMRTKLERAGFTSLFVLDEKKHDEQTVSTLRQAFAGVLDLRVEPAGPGTAPKVTVRSLRGPSVTSDAVALDFGFDNRLRVRPSELPRLLRAHEELMKSNPGDSTAWATTARILRETGDSEAALWAVETALSTEPESSELWLLKADLLDALGRKEEAETTRSRAPPPPPQIEFSPLDEAATRLMGVCEARLREDPADGAALFVKAAAQAKLGDLPAAVATLDSLAAVDGYYPGLWVLKAKLHDVLGEREKADESRIRARERAERPTPEVRSLDAADPGARKLPPPKPSGSKEPRGFTNGVQPMAVRFVGPTQGLVNGTAAARGGAGRVNGLSRAPQGRTNGVSQAFVSMRAGMTNGLTTSTGFTNGLGSPGVPREVRMLRQKLLLIPLVVAALLFLPLLTPLGPADGAQIAIDGRSADWANAFVATSARTPGLDPNVDIVRFGAAENGNGVAFLVEVDGSALRGGDAPPTVDRFDVFVDTDRDASTGYRVDGLGAERLVELAGWQSVVNESTLFEWNLNADPYDWRGWSRTTWVTAAAAGRGLEVQVDWLALGIDPGPIYAIVHARSFDGSTDAADYALNPLGPALVVLQEPIPEATLTGSDDALLRLDVTAYGAEARLRGLTISLTGSTPSSAVGLLRVIDENGLLVDERAPVNGVAAFQFPERRYPAGSSERLVVVAGSPSATGETLGAILDGPSAVVASDAVITVHRLPSVYDVGYIGSEVSFPRVDSGLAEWTSVVADPAGDTQGGRDQDVDLGAFAVESDGNGTFFFVEVEGRLMAGTWIPERNALAPPARLPIPTDTDRDGVPDFADPLPDDFNNDGTPDAQAAGDADGDGVVDYGRGGPDLWLNTTIPSSFPVAYAGRDVRLYIGPVERPFRPRDDVLRVFIDMDNSTGNGYQVGGLGADRLVEVSGSAGQVRSSGLFSFTGSYPGQWSWARVSNVASALTFDHLEFAVPATLPGASRVYVEIGEALGTRDAFGGAGAASLVESVPSAAASPRRASSFDVAPAPLPAGFAGAPVPPRVLDIPGNDVFYLRHADHATENDAACLTDKVADGGPRVAPVDTATLSVGQAACWYVDATTGQSIPSGDWESLLDVSLSSTYSSKAGAFNIGTGGIGTTVPVTGVGFQPKVAILWWSGRTETIDAAGTQHHQRGFGVAVSTTDRRAICSSSEDGVAPGSHDVGGAHRADAAICSLSGASGSLDGLGDLSSMDADGFTMIIDDVFATNLRIHYLALGGSALTNVATGMFTESAATGNQDVTTVGFQPDAVILFSAMIGADPPGTCIAGSDTCNLMTVGFAAGGGDPADVVWAGASDDNSVQTVSYHKAGESIALFDTGATTTNGRADVDAWLVNGFSLNWNERAGSRRIHYLALKGGSYVVGDLLTLTSSGTIAEPGFGFSPKASLFLSHNKAQSSADVVQDHDELSVGAFSSTTARGAQCVIDVDGVGTSDIGTAVEHDEVYCNLDTTPGSAPAIEGLMGIQSVDSDGFTLVMDDPDPVASFVGYIAFGADVDYAVYFEIWDKTADSIRAPIGSCLGLTAAGDDRRCLVSAVPSQTIASNEVVRIRVVHSGSAGTVSIDYDDADTTGDSRATIPPVGIPEFEAEALSSLAAILVVFSVVGKRRAARRLRSLSPGPPDATDPGGG